MNYEKLEKNLSEIIYEAQLKIGYDKRGTSMNYPATSLAHLLEVEPDGVLTALEGFVAHAAPRLGKITFTPAAENIIRLTVPEAGVEYIHEHSAGNRFLPELIELIKSDNATLEDAEALFRRYSEHVHVQPSGNDEFDWLMYFEDGKPDEYYYCLTQEGPRLTYHRFTREDYDDFGF